MWSPKDGYNLVASVYDTWYWKPFWSFNEKPHIEQLIYQVENARLALDVGCGTGTYCAVLEKHCQTIGVDPSVKMLNVARRHISSSTLVACAQASSLPFALTNLDITIAARSLCHEPNLVQAFQELARLTRSGGVCIISDVHAEHDYPRTRIPLGSYDVHIETFKRTPEEIMEIVAANAEWDVEHKREFRWNDLSWKPEDNRFFRVDRAGHRPIFFVMVLRRRKDIPKADRTRAARRL